MVLSLYEEVKRLTHKTFVSHDRYQYHSLILSKQTWANPHQHLQGRWLSADVTKECLETNFHLSSKLLRKLCVHYANGFYNVESVYFFYSNPV
jgi:ribosome-associated toxin RatA of RatAB toxin-antitoxin module